MNAPRRLRATIVTETYPPEINGVALTIAQFVQGLLARNHRVQLIRPRQSAQDKPQNTSNFEEILSPAMPLPRYNGLRLGLPINFKLARIWKENPPDIVHIATEGPLGWSAMHVANRLGICVSTDFHTNFHSYSRYYGLGRLYPLINAYLRYFHNKTQATLVPHQGVQDQLSACGYRNLFVVGRGVDTTLFHPAKRSQRLRASWGVKEGEPVALYVGRLAAEKNLPVVFAAFAAMQTLEPRAKLVLVGDGPLRAPLQRSHREHIFSGLRRGEELAVHYASADIFLFPSITETFGNVTIEALSSGLAVVAYDYAAAAQHISHEDNGLLAPLDNSEAFVAAAVWLIQNPGKLSVIKRRARENVKLSSWQTVSNGFEEVLLKLTNVATSLPRIPAEQV